MKKWRVGIIGVGGIFNGAHREHYLKDDRLEVVALCDIIEERAVECRDGFFPDAKVYTDFNELLKDETIDSVDICTPNYLHSIIAVAAFKAGKHVFCEKPDAVNVEEVMKMNDAAKAAGKTLMVMRNNRYYENSQYLKKYIESDLYILADKKSNTFVLQQVFFMLAAGLSMVFATVVSFSFQQTYGNFTMPLFIALVVSYMFKDRIKDLMHYWFANKLGSKFYDYKIKLVMHGEPVGWGKEGCDFVNEEKLPLEVRAQRGRVSELEAGHCALRETVIVYRRRISILDKQLKLLSHYPLQGFNDIIRINLRDFLRRMDSPHVPVYMNEGKGEFHTQAAEKVYYVHFVMRYRYQGKTGYRRFRITLTRRGIKGLMEW